MLGFLLIVAAIFGKKQFEEKYLHAEKAYIIQTLWFHDLAVLEQASGQKYIPEQFRSEFYSDDLIAKALEDKRCSDALHFPWESPFRTSKNKELVQGLFRGWLQAIWNHPRVYLNHRLEMWKGFMSWGFAPCRFTSFYFEPKFGTRLPGSLEVQSFFEKWIDLTLYFDFLFKPGFGLQFAFFQLFTLLSENQVV